jgi:hypothetical protein
MAFPAQELLLSDERFQRAYRLTGVIKHSRNGYWCIFERHGDAQEPVLGPGAQEVPGSAARVAAKDR